MVQVAWHEPGTRRYSAGVDRGVLYVGMNEGVAWNGLISVSQRSVGAEPQPGYIDGQRFMNYASIEEFEATIKAFASPYEFDVCDGTLEIKPGYLASNQIRQEFGLSYRTRIGNELDQNHGYRIHMIYNALATPSDIDHSTIGADVTADALSWDISTRPIQFQDFAPTAHFAIDTITSPIWQVQAVEKMLYGSEDTPSRLPTPESIYDMAPGVYGLAVYDLNVFGD